MKLTKKERTIKYACFCLLLMLGALLQNVGGLWLEIGGARCFFLIPIAMLLGVDEDEFVASGLGLFAGLLWDSVSASHMGFNAVFIMLMCYVSSSLVSYLFVSTYWVKFIMCFVAELLYVILYWLLFVVLKGGDGAVETIFNFYLPCFLYTAALTLPIVSILNSIVNKLNKEPKFD